MTRIDLPYIFKGAAKGRPYYYYRRNGQYIPIHDENGEKLAPSDPAFLAAYTAIHETFGAPTPRSETAKGSLAHLIDAYRVSPDFKEKSPKTRKDYGLYLELMKEKYGKRRVAAMPREFIFGLRDKYAATPRKANYIIQVLRLILSYAEDRPSTFSLPQNWSNPARRPKLLKTGDGHRPWEESEILAFRKCWKVGTLERTAFELALNTGQRGGDVIDMRRGHINNNGTISVAQEKTGARLEIPIATDLKNVLATWLEKTPHMMILATETGRPFKVDHFRHTMRDAYRKARLPEDCTTHGLRYTAATRLREIGCDWEEIADITGHETAEMARKYSNKARRAKLTVARLDDARMKQRKNKESADSDKPY